MRKNIAKGILGRIVRAFPPSEVLEGYQNPELIETVFRKAMKFTPSGDWQEFSNRSAVLDFGGGFGQHYKCAATLSPHVRWAIVETPSVVARAREIIHDRLRFFENISAASAWLGATPDLIHSDGALQYMADPAATVAELCEIGAPEVLWKRTYLAAGDQTEIGEQLSRLDENGPRVAGDTISRKIVRFRVTRITEAAFTAPHVGAGYRLAERVRDRFRFVR